jgi:NADH oxidase (H2O2-forming)
METSVDDVYACGDCVESKNVVTGKTTMNLLWPNAIQQGRVAGSNALGMKKEYHGSVNINTIDVFGTHIASIGCNQTDVEPGGEYEVLEKKYGNQYHSIIVSDGRIVGAQSIERLDHLGVLLKAVRKHTRIDDLKKMGYEREYFLKNPWYTKISVYL